MKPEKNIKYYFRIYIIAVVVYVGYVSYLAYQNGGYDFALLFGVTYIPILFIAFMFGFDKIFDKVFPSRERKEEDAFKVFVKQVNAEIDKELDFSIEDFRHLRQDMRFRKALYHAFLITEQGETEQINFVFLEKKFKKDTNEARAMEIIIKEVKKMM